MRLKADQLAASLDRRGLMPVYLISGDEPLQILETADLIRHYARANGFEERMVLDVNKDFDWRQLMSVNAALSLFASRRLIELRLETGKPGREGSAALLEYTAAANPDNVLLVIAGKLDKRTLQSRWCKALDEAGLVIQIWPVEPVKLPAWIIKRTQQYGKRMSRDAATFIAEKVEGNLLAAKQELEKLCLLVDRPGIDIKDAMDAVSDSARFDIFTLIENTLQGDIERTARMLRGLRKEGVEPLAVVGALMWEFRRICSMAFAIDAGTPREKVFTGFRVWQQRRSAVDAVLDRLDKKQLASLLRLAGTLDKAVKGAIKNSAWELLENFMFRMAGIRLQSLDRIVDQDPGGLG
ncbi:MAG: DNA polymerase III subunit delta [Gammaproteobacteria bacterium]